MKMICPNCGKEYNEKMTCCISCGADLVPYESESEQACFEPIIPDIPDISDISESGLRNETVSEVSEVSVGFERTLKGHSEYPPKKTENAAKDGSSAHKRKGLAVSGAARGIGSFAASAVMFALIIIASAAAGARLITSSGKISEFAARLDVMNLPASDTVMFAADDYQIEPDATLQEAIFVMSAGTGLTREDIRRIYESSTAEDFLASQLSGYAGYIRDGELPEKLTSEKLKEVFSENIGLIGSAIGKPLSQHDIDLAFAELDRAEPVLEAIAPSRIESTASSGTLTILRLFTSVPVIIGESAAAAAMLIVLWAINRRSERVLGWGGGTVFAGGAVILVTTFLTAAQVFFSEQDRFFRSVAKCAAAVIAPDLYRIGGSLAALGAVMLLWAATLKKQRR